MTRTWSVHLGCIPVLVLLALLLAAVYWIGLGALVLFIEVLTTITAIGAGPP